ncbi:protein takeout-like [Drosophila suzukii]|uniref:Protein takeout-like n=1 Tax=Drosophila suzukii TaxID=28584 RepID=A0AB39ZLM6_DROSZ
MGKLILLTWLFCYILNTISGAELPGDVQKCSFGNSTCLVRSINTLIKLHPKGIPAIGLPPLDSYHFPDTVVLDSPNRPIYLNFNMRDNVNKGFENTTVTHVEGFLREPNQKQILIKAHLPRLLHLATYDLEGRWLFCHKTSGTLQSDFQDFRVTLTLKVILEYRNNKRYLKVYDLVPSIYLGRWIIWFDDLFKENFDLTVAMNAVFNRHWVEFWNELHPGLKKSFSNGFTTILNRVFENVAYDDMFLPDR